MEYYIERKGLILPEKIKITKQQLRKFWCQIYFYFKDKKSFELAEHGKEKGNNKISLKLAPSPEQFFLQHIGNIELYPIDIKTIEKYENGIKNLKKENKQIDNEINKLKVIAKKYESLDEQVRKVLDGDEKSQDENYE